MVSSDFPNYYSVYIVYNLNVKFNSLLTLEYPEFFFFFFSTSSQKLFENSTLSLLRRVIEI